MALYRIVICEDLREDALRLCRLVTEFFEAQALAHKISAFESAEALLALFEDGERFDAYFLDIYMGGMDGMRLAERIREKDERGAILFTTQSVDFAIQGYKVMALDYLVKPVDPAQLERALLRLLSRTDGLSNLAIRVKDKAGYTHLQTRDIRYLESLAHTVWFHMADQTKLPVTGRLGDIAQALDKHRFFVRCHKSYMVNLDHVKTFGGGSLSLGDGARICVSRSYAKQAREKYNNYLLLKMTEGKPI